MENKDIAQTLLQVGAQLNQLAIALLRMPETEVPVVPVKSREVPKGEIVSVKKRAVTYDNDPSSPSYDPEPPFTVEPVPPRTVATDTHTLLLKEGQQIKCSKCGNIVFDILRNVYADKIEGAAFQVAVGGLELEDLTISKGINAPGLYADCPVCDAVKGVRIFGPVEKPAATTASAINEEVSSI